ncbi:hypothetical protein [Pseudomonas sp.]|uniref:hypothetical protein n=1 Tax=Pseudomonas sp. TaxID=306 RepID=UPI00262247FA|nr:hypothetical protein [Pseudomonas sp.]
MSMSINTPPAVKVDASAFDQQKISTNNVIVKPNAQPQGATLLQSSLRSDDTLGLGNTLITPETALKQLFDMLEGIFRAMRDIFAGRTAMKPDSGKLPIALDAGKELIKPDAGKLPAVPNALKELVKPDAGKLPAVPNALKELVKPDAGKLPAVPDALKELVKPDAGKLPAVPDAPKALVKPDAPKLTVLPQPGDVPVNVPDGKKLRPMPFSPTVPRPETSVNNDPKTNVNVNVVLSHCHCPDGTVLPDRLPKPWVSTDIRPQPAVLPDARPQAPLLPGNFPRPNMPVDTRSQPAVLPDNQPTPFPDAPTQDLTSPGPVEDRPAGRHGRFNHRLSSRF